MPTITDYRQGLMDSAGFYPDKTPQEREILASQLIPEPEHLEAAATPPEVEAGIIFEQSNLPADIHIEASQEGNILRFKNAILAVSEKNGNNDRISDENIQELVATLAGHAVDVDHRHKQNCGVITAARPVTYKGRPAVAIDGLGWRNRYQEEWDGVQSGAYHLSVEADPDEVLCSLCGKSVSASNEYCEHLKNRKTSGAERLFKGLRGSGAGITRNPAGTGTTFDRSQIYVVAHIEDDLEAHWYDGKLPRGQTLDDLPASDFADPSGRRFPYKIHGKADPEGWHAAWSAANGGHTGTKDTSAIEKLRRDKPAGAEINESQEAVMDKCPHCGAELKGEAHTCPSCGKSLQASVLASELKTLNGSLETRQTELSAKQSALQAALDELEALKAYKVEAEPKLVQLQASLAEKDQKLEEANHTLTEHKNTAREAEVKPLLSETAWTERKAKFLAMDDETFATVVASLREVKPAPKEDQKKPALIGLRSGMPGPGAGSATNSKPKLSLGSKK